MVVNYHISIVVVTDGDFEMKNTWMNWQLLNAKNGLRVGVIPLFFPPV